MCHQADEVGGVSRPKSAQLLGNAAMEAGLAKLGVSR